MNRILLWILVLVPVGVGVISIKNRVKAQEDDIAKIQRQIIAEKEQLRILNAEWHKLTTPKRIEHLARTYLKLDKTSASKIAKLKNIPLVIGQPVEYMFVDQQGDEPATEMSSYWDLLEDELEQN